MNLEKLLGELANVWAHHAPTVVMHVVVLATLRLWVLDPELESTLGPLWRALKGGVDRLLAEVGINVERGYAIAALAYLYLSAVQWLANAVSRLPGVRTWLASPTLDLDFARSAAHVLRTAPDLHVVRKELDERVAAYARAYREREKADPYDWLQREVTKWSRFYGLSVLLVFATAVWIARGAPGALTGGRAVALLVGLAGFAILARWRLGRSFAQREQQMRYAALREAARDRPEGVGADPLAYLRGELLRDSITYWRAFERHPASIIHRLSWRLPFRVPDEWRRRLPPPPALMNHGDWEIGQSHAARHGELGPVPPRALRTEAYESRFPALLECRGAGLCLLVDGATGLAPSARGGGSGYCLATRSHDGSVMRVDYLGPRGGDPGRLRIQNYDQSWGFLADAGSHPIEQLIQHRVPPGSGAERWYDLIGPSLDTTGWSSAQFDDREPATVAGIAVRSWMPVAPGHTYVLRVRLRSGTEVAAAITCFEVGEPGRVLLAWAILAVLHERRVVPHIWPWWTPMAWRSLLK